MSLPALVLDEGEQVQRSFLEFFLVSIRNENTRAAYARAVKQFFWWCEQRGVRLREIEPLVVAAYIESHPGSAPTVKQHLAAIRALFDWLVRYGTLPQNPAAAVRGPKYVIKKGKTPVLQAEDVRSLLKAIDVHEVGGMRDRAIIGVMLYTFARVGAVVRMKVEDYYHVGKRSWIRLNEKGGKHHEVPAHHALQEYLDEYLGVAAISEAGVPLFQTLTRRKELSGRALLARDVQRLLKKRARAAGITEAITPHTFRATGITLYLGNGGTLERAQAIAAHESPTTTKLYDRTQDKITLGEVERILI